MIPKPHPRPSLAAQYYHLLTQDNVLGPLVSLVTWVWIAPRAGAWSETRPSGVRVPQSDWPVTLDQVFGTDSGEDRYRRSKTRIGFLLGFALISGLVRYFSSRGESNSRNDNRQLN